MQLNPYLPASCHSSCNVFMMEKTLFEYLVEEAYSRTDTDFVRDVLLKKVQSLRIYGWRYDGYVGCLSSVPSYFSHNMNVLNSQVRQDLFNPKHPIYTKVKDEVPAKYLSSAQVKNSLIADGCVIDGQVENCVLFRGVRVEHGVKLRNSLILQSCIVQEGAELDYVILDKSCTVQPGRRLMGNESFPVIIRKGSVV